MQGEDKREEDFQELEKALGVSFRDKELLKRALTHSSYRISHRHEVPEDNERLEFVGDALLNLCVSLILYERFPADREGDLTKKRAYLVCKERLVKVAEALRLHEFLLTGAREKNLDLKSRLNMAGRAVEAIIGAIFLDQGLEKTCEVVNRIFAPYLRSLKLRSLSDAKSRLQEYLQKARGLIPAYEVLKITGPAHKPEIEVAVKVGEEIIAKAKGASRKEAENLAAKRALNKLKRTAKK